MMMYVLFGIYQEILGDIMITILYDHILEITRYVTWLGF